MNLNLPCESPPSPGWPASYDGVIGVSASDEDEDFPTNYNYGSHIDVNAPGIDVSYLGPSGSITSGDGTSFSSPMVAALIAVLMAEDSSPSNYKLNIDDFIDIFKESCDELGDSSYTNGYNTQWGYGRINAYNALLEIKDGANPSTPANFSLTSHQLGGTYRPKLSWTKSSDLGVYGYEIYRSLNGGTTYSKIKTVDDDVEEYIDMFIVIWASGNSETAYYKMRAADREGRYSSYTVEDSIDYEIELDFRETDPSIPDEFSLSPSYPNPFNPSTTIKFGVPKEAIVSLTIYDINGREVVRLLNQKLNPGYHRAICGGRNSAGNQVSTGIYFYRIIANATDGTEKFVHTNKMIFAK